MKKPACLILAAALLLCGLAGCRNDRKPIFEATGPLEGEFVTEGGSKLTFIDDGNDDWTSGDVLVEFMSDAEFLLEDKENHTTYRYKFGFQNGNAAYLVFDDFYLTNGDGVFAKCRSMYTIKKELVLRPYTQEDLDLIFRQEVEPDDDEAPVPSESGPKKSYNFELKDNGYYGVVIEEEE